MVFLDKKQPIRLRNAGILMQSIVPLIHNSYTYLINLLLQNLEFQQGQIAEEDFVEQYDQ